jgi:hypothetical protein
MAALAASGFLIALSGAMSASGDPVPGTTRITSVSPVGGATAGMQVVITGSGFTGTTGVWFGATLNPAGTAVATGSWAPFQIASDSTLYTKVPGGARSGPIVVCSATGCAASAPYGISTGPLPSPVTSWEWTIWRVGAEKGQLVVENTGFSMSIDKFVWTPPKGVTVTRISSTKGGTCTVAARLVTCVASLLPPGCGATGTLSMRFGYAGRLGASPTWVTSTTGSAYGTLMIKASTYLPLTTPACA